MMPGPSRLVFCFLVMLPATMSTRWALADDPDQPIKNVVFIVADDLKAGVLGCYGDSICRTPHLDALAKRGTVFTRAYCQGTWCLPSRISFMFGRYRDQKNVTLGEHLQSHGFYTARVGKIFHMRVPGDIIAGTDGKDVAACWTERFNAPGLEAHTPGNYACLNLNIFTRDLENRQSTRMPHRMFVSVVTDGDGHEQADYKAAGKAVELIRQRNDEPFFLAVGLVRPHYPMVAPEDYFRPYPIDKISMPENWKDDTSDIPKSGLAATRNSRNPIGKYPDNQKRMWSAYYASVAFMDAQVGRILSALQTSPHRDNTAVIFTSDHGYHLGEHGFWQKANLHEQVIRVPLIISAPGMPAGESDSLAELVDLYPTICDLVGTRAPAAAEGISLRPVLENASVTVKSDALSFHNGISLRTDRWHYMQYKDDTEELYDMQNDPDETTNLASESSSQPVIRSLRIRLRERMDHLTGSNVQR